MGGTLRDSVVVHGMVAQRGSETSITDAPNAKICVFNTSIEMQVGETKGTVKIQSAEELLGYSKGEEDQMEKFV